MNGLWHSINALARGRRLAAALAALWLAGALAGCAAPEVLPRLSASMRPVIEPNAFVLGHDARLPLDMWAAKRPRAVIVALHGFNGYAEDFVLAGPWFARHGITVYAYDQPGFGRNPPSTRGIWPGSDTLIADLKTFTSLVRRRHRGLPVYVLGFSMGGAVAMAAATRGLDADGLILVSPAVWGWREMNPVYKSALWLTAHTVPAGTASGGGLGILPTDNMKALRAYSRDPLNIKHTRFDAMYGLVGLMDEADAAAAHIRLPVLYLYGRHDEIVPTGASRAIVRQIEAPRRLVVYRNGWHMLLHDRQRETVYRDIAAWIADRRARLPSGEEIRQP